MDLNMDGMNYEQLVGLTHRLSAENELLKGAVGSGMQGLEPHVALPNKFDGSRGNCRNFMNQVKLIFQLQPKRYSSDATKVAFIGTLLSGSASTWFSPHFESGSTIMSDIALFWKEFEDTFGDLERAVTAANKIRTLRQGTLSASEYASLFRRLASDLDWGEAALADQFRRGLRDDVKDLLLTLPPPKSLSEAIHSAIACDNRIFERKSERRGNNYSQGHLAYRQHNSEAIPMEIDSLHQSERRRKGPLTPEERARRRRLNLCMYCGESGHLVKDCRSKPAQQEK